LQFERGKSKATLIALFLLFAMAISLVALPNANAQTTKQTYAFLGVVPNPVGVNQGVIMHVGITDQNVGGVGSGWTGLSVTITRPDGVVETLKDIMTDSTGGTGVTYTPTMAGNYTLQSHFPQQQYMPYNYTYLASDSAIVTLVVQEEPIAYYPGQPLPTEYWTRPIDPQLRSWWGIGGSWLQSTPTNKFAIGNDEAPETAHVLWTKPLTSGGLEGGSIPLDVSIGGGPVGYDTGDAYEGKFIQRFIAGGKLYYEMYATADPYKETACVDLHTGEQLWARTLLNNLTISFVQLMYWETYDFMGVYDYLWCTGNSGTRDLLGLDSSAGTTWCAFDPFNGDFVWALYGIPSGTTVMSQKGEILRYYTNLGTSSSQTTGYMMLWNGTNIPGLRSSRVYNSMGWGQWRAMGKIINATENPRVTFGGSPYTPTEMPLPGLSGYMWNVTIPKGLPGSVTTIFEGDRIIGGRLSTTEVNLWALNLNTSKGDIGDLLFNHTWTPPAYWAEGNVSISGFSAGWMAWSQEDYVGVMWIKETREHYGFSLETGDYMWGPTEPQYYLDAIDDSSSDVRNIAYGKLYSASVGGICYCYDVKNGTRLWQYAAEDPYTEFFWSNNWWLKPLFIADGKIYLGHTEHSVNTPMPRGAPFICLNATTGEEIWRVNGMFRQTRWGGRGIIGDSIIATMDTYDQRVYAIGKGPSATTVSAGPAGSVLGSGVVVTGMVTDVSPGTNDAGLKMRFPNGVPAVADENQSDWMLHVYKQFELPADVVGVEVVISVLDPNNNCYEVGRATSDASGFFHCAFTPPVPGEYTVYANFEGSKAYWQSSAETAIFVDPAPDPTPAPTPTPAPMTDTYLLGSTIGIIVAIIVVGLLLFLLLRKR
jgi:hypothetical protein